jgi:hypothetical protein
MAQSPQPPIDPVAPLIIAPPPAPMSFGKTLWVFANTVRRGIDSVYGLLLLAGMVGWRHLWRRHDQQALFWVSMSVLAGMWVHLWYAQESSSRYVLSIVLLGTPFAALGWLAICQTLTAVFQRTRGQSPSLATTFAVSLLFIGMGGCGHALTNRYDNREREAVLGKWIRAGFGPGRRLMTWGRMDLMDYYADSRGEVVPAEASVDTVLQAIAARRPELVVVSRRAAGTEAVERLLAQASQLGFTQLDIHRLPSGHDWKDMVVLAGSMADQALRAVERHGPER